MLKDLGQVGVWLAAADLEPSQLDEKRIAQFLAATQARGCRAVPGPRGMRPLLSYLRQAGATPAAPPASTPLARLLVQYRRWMVAERGPAPMTVLRYDNTARRLLSEHAVADGELDVRRLTGADLHGFLPRKCGRVSAESAKGRVAELRSVLRFLAVSGLTDLSLAQAVPAVAG